jgi:pseudaminic acid synthase
MTYKKPFIIAEISGNHKQSLKRALKLIDAAADAGADAIKLQTFTPESMTLNIKKNEFLLKDKKIAGTWRNKTLFEIFKKAQTPWEWHKEIFYRAKKRGLNFFSSPFDESAVDFLETLNVPFYKIASAENIHFPLLKKVTKTKKPLIISTGMINTKELDEVVSYIRRLGCKNITLLKCTTEYPASAKDSNILTIPYLKQRYKCDVGLSDHTLGIGASIAAIAHGATVIEKHLTLNRKDGAIDSFFSLEPNEFRSLVKESKIAFESLGKIKIDISKSEKKYLKYRRSIYIAEDIKKNQKFNKMNLKVIRPGLGLHPKFYEKLIGKKSKRDLKKGTAMKKFFA